MPRIGGGNIGGTGGGGGTTQASPRVFNVLADGAVGDYDWKTNTGTDSTAAFRAAYAKAVSATLTGAAAEVYVPAGNYLLEPPGGLPNRVTLRGDGPGATRLYRKGTGTTTGPFITNDTNARMCTFTGFAIDGRGIGDATSHGLHLNNSAAADTDTTGANPLAEYVDARHYASDILIQSVKGNGLHHTGRGTSMVDRVQAWMCDGHGFSTGTDSFFTDCDSGNAGLDGFYVAGANTRLTACKGWYSGRISTTGAGVTGGTGHGFHIRDGNYATNTLTGCEAQDNARAGYFLSNVGRQIVNGCVADSNNAAGLNHAGFEVLASYYNRVSGFGWDRAQNTNHQLASLRVTGGGNNWVDVTGEIANQAEGLATLDSDFSGSVVVPYPRSAVLPGRPEVGAYLSVAGSSTATTQLTVANQAIYMPVDVAIPTRVDAIGLNVSAAGVGTGLVLRFALHNDNGMNRPGTVVLDAGTVDPTTTGDKVLPFTAQRLVPSRYWVAVILQGTVTTGPTVVSTSPLNPAGLSSLANVSHRAWAAGGIAGAVTAAPTGLFRVGNAPNVGVRVAA